MVTWDIHCIYSRCCMHCKVGFAPGVCVYVCVYVRMCVCVCVCMCECTYVCMYVCMHLCKYVIYHVCFTSCPCICSVVPWVVESWCHAPFTSVFFPLGDVILYCTNLRLIALSPLSVMMVRSTPLCAYVHSDPWLCTCSAISVQCL